MNLSIFPGSRSGSGAASHRRAFTLLELLVVIALIGLLAGLLFPALVSVRESARRAVCFAHLGQISKAHMLYLQDWDERLVHWHLPAAPRPEPFGPRLYWTEYLQPYLRESAPFRDPSAAAQARGDAWLADYAMATWGPGGMNTPEQPYYRWPGPPLSLGQVRRPSRTIQWIDGRCTTRGAIMDSWTDRGWALEGAFRHGSGNVALFVDGHARWLPAAEVQRVDSDGEGNYWLRYGSADR